MDRSTERWSAIWWVAGIAALGIASRPARATVIAHVELATMAREADAVVHAVVERTGTQMGYNASTSPWSVAELRVLQWLSGGEGERLWIRDPGAVCATAGKPAYVVLPASRPSLIHRNRPAPTAMLRAPGAQRRGLRPRRACSGF